MRREVSYLGNSSLVSGTLLDITMVNPFALDYQARPLIARFGILRVEADEYMRKHEDLEAYEDVHESLYECELSWCMKGYGPAKVENGILKESAPTQSNFLDKTDALNFSAKPCIDNAIQEESNYKTFRFQDDLDYSNDTEQHRRLADAFYGCPDIAALSKDEDVYVVNAFDEVGIR